jgi:hypothetical protein
MDLWDNEFQYHSYILSYINLIEKEITEELCEYSFVNQIAILCLSCNLSFDRVCLLTIVIIFYTFIFLKTIVRAYT